MRLELGARYRWEPCVAHRSCEVDEFVACHFTQPDRKIFLVAGAGFDPRSCTVADRLAKANIGVNALLIRENRPKLNQIQSRAQSDRADDNTAALIHIIPNHQVTSIDIFAFDGAVIGGRNAVKLINQQRLGDVTDVIVDVSALSVGVSFPIIRFLVEYVGRHSVNLHVFVVHDPHLDRAILAG